MDDSSIPDVRITSANEKDLELVLEFIRALADYERLADEVVVTVDHLRQALFSPTSNAEAVIAYYRNEPAGFAIFFHNFSTFLGRKGIYLEDLFVKPLFRGKGIGKSLLSHLAKLAVERNCGRFEWAVLDWNEPAIGFYKRLGAEPMDQWTVFRLTGDALQDLAST